MKKKGIKKDLFIIAVITIVTITVWVVLDIFLTFQKSTVPAVTKKLMEPLNPKLNTEVLDELEKKDFFNLSEGTPASRSQEIPTEVR